MMLGLLLITSQLTCFSQVSIHEEQDTQQRVDPTVGIFQIIRDAAILRQRPLQPPTRLQFSILYPVCNRNRLIFFSVVASLQS
jgi:hypothetical protein